MRSSWLSSLFSFRRIGLVEVPGDRAGAPVLDELALGHRLAIVHEADRQQRPVARVRGVADVGALGETLAYTAVAVVDLDHPHPAALAGQAQLVGEVDAAGAVVAQ